MTNNNNEPSVLIVGLNPALQKRFILPIHTDLIPGDVHRATSIQTGVGGKGQDVFMTLSCLGSSSSSSTSKSTKSIAMAQFIGKGPEGDNVLQLLEEQLPYDTSFTVRPESPIRTCTTIVATEHSTELVEPSGMIESKDLEDLFERVQQQQQTKTGFNTLCIMGSMPPGCPSDTYATLWKRMVTATTSTTDATDATDTENAKGEPQTYFCLIDSVIGLEEIIMELKESRTKDVLQIHAVLKINLSELCKLGGISIKDISSLSEKEQILHVIQSFTSVYTDSQKAFDYIAITAGKDPAYLVQLGNKDDDEDDENGINVWKLDIPNLNQDYPNQTLYPIGAGDSVAAGTLAAWLELSTLSSSCLLDPNLQRLVAEKKSHDEKNMDSFACAFAFGLACGSASCLQEQNSILDQGDLIQLFDNMEPPLKL